MAFGGLFGSSAPSSPVSQQPKFDSETVATILEIQTKVQEEFAINTAKTLVDHATEQCFTKCLKAPYAVSSSSLAQDNNCVESCLAKYLRSWNEISKAYVGRLQQQPPN
jgi:mitochondrial import inner membrane translocase subunit TIM13